MKIFRVLAIVLLLSWMVVIFCFSAENSNESSDTSGKVISVIVRVFRWDFNELTPEEQQELIAPLQMVVRKGAHFTIYAILGVFSFLTYITYKKFPLKFRLIIIPMTCLLYAVSDEIHQTFVPGRCGDIKDVCIDFCGSLLSISILTLIARSKKFKKYI